MPAFEDPTLKPFPPRAGLGDGLLTNRLEPLRIHGLSFVAGTAPIRLAGSTYGTFRPRPDGHRFPPTSVIAGDLDAITSAGLNCIRTYTEPPDDLLACARASGVRVFAGLHTTDPRYLVGMSRSERTKNVKAACKSVSNATARLRGHTEVAAVCLGNEIPADVVRWYGRDWVESTVAQLAEAAHEGDPDRLVTYANFPSTEYLDLPTLDFVTVNVFLEDPHAFSCYLVRLQNLAGDRPLVIGELGMHVAEQGDESLQASMLATQLRSAHDHGVAGSFVFSWTDEWQVGDHPVDDWRFGLTRADRSSRPALASVSGVHRADAGQFADTEVRTTEERSVSVVICARDEASYITECLTAATSLNYGSYEVIVVDDGSTDGTAEIARSFDRVITVSIPHSGLGTARNVGLETATGEIISYLDADAYPHRDWLRQLTRGFDDPDVAAAGGPNLVPAEDPRTAQMVGLAPGGPVHVLTSDNRAEHVPGCNMAFRREVLLEIGAFDPVYRSAGDDVDVCWKLLDRHWQIAFRPAAVVFHHRRASVRAYLRQQRAYGHAEALVAARHPDRFTRLGTARWRGNIYSGSAQRSSGDRIYAGPFGTAAFQSIYRSGGHGRDVAHQLGIPLAVGMMLATAVGGLLWHPLWWPAAASVAFVAGLFVADTVDAPVHRVYRDLRFRMGVAGLQILQPVVRTWGRLAHAPTAPPADGGPILPGPVRDVAGGVLLLPHDRPRRELVPAIAMAARRAGLRVSGVTGWEDHDGRLTGSALIGGELVTSAHPQGAVQVRVRLRPHGRRMAAALLSTLAVAASLGPAFGAGIAISMALDCLLAGYRLGPRFRRAVRAAAI